MLLDQARFERLIEIGIALSAEKDTNKLMERILLEAKDLGNADGGSLYIRTTEDTLEFAIIRNDSLELAQGGSGEEIKLPPQKMFNEDGSPNEKQIVSKAALSGQTLNIADAYDSAEFDFSGTMQFDQGTGYRTTSVLTVPLKNSQNEVIGVLQLLNSLDSETGDVIAFSEEIQPLIEALASQAAVALDNALLIKAQEDLLSSFIALMARAVDAKSPYTGGHCERVPELTEMLTRAACGAETGPFAEFDLTDDEWFELHIGAWLHDCGKVTTPEYVVDKATKLETITDRIHEIRMRFEVAKREAIIACQEDIIAGSGTSAVLRKELETRLAELDRDFEFVAECNLGGEFMSDEQIDRVRRISEQTWTRTLDDRIGIAREELLRRERRPKPELPVSEPLLADRYDHLIHHDAVPYSADPENLYDFKMEVPEHKFNFGEIYNLCISRGTLTKEERFKINDHIVQTIVMLESLPFPKHLSRVPEIAGGHHEKMDGTGYPKKLRGEQMSIPARIMAIADVFEALTAADRPYKSPKKLSESIRIMAHMVEDRHLDADLFRLFLESGVYKEYANKFLLASQIDDVDTTAYH